ncbi:MAG: hypothetical protein S4CHLAM45_01880 [Chlamydiales bacterium]|nr:hypothetical protein [Chlamydiales bacterium]MCH9619507.1 hypothetical protein [Chlamydiales bacterium]MCH9622311.1 hypothetical protein [Chlamydiales bacterium]
MQIFRKILFLLPLLCSILSAKPNPDLIEKTKQAKHQLEKACSYAGNRPIEKHRALISAYWCNPGDFVLDIGAHLGDFSRIYSSLVGKEGLVFAYEPNPLVYPHLEHFMALSSIKNVITKKRAVSDTTGEMVSMKINADTLSYQGSSLEPLLWNDARMPGNTTIVKVETEKLDDLLEEKHLPPIRFIKIDVEGHEHAVLRGAEKILLTQRPLVIFEYGYVKGEFEPDTIRQMEEMGYACYDCATDQRVSPNYERVVTDLLGIPKEFEKEIVSILPYLY